MDIGHYGALHAIQERHWWYAARRTILDTVLADAFAKGIPPGVLYDLGCGVGANLPVLERYGEVMGVDSSADAVEFCRVRGHTNVRQTDLTGLDGLPEGSGSVAVLADVIEHLDNDRACLEATRKLLAPGGAVVITVPAYEFLWGPSDDLAHHRRRYTESGLRRVVSGLFTVERLTYFNTLLFAPILVGRVLERVLSRPGVDGFVVPSAPINAALQAIFASEVPLMRRLHLPFGVSILCVGRKSPSLGD